MRSIPRLIVLAACGLLVTAAARAQSADVAGQAHAQAGAAAKAGGANVQNDLNADARAQAQAQADAARMRESLERKAAKVSGETKAGAESHLDATSHKVDAMAQKSGDAAVAARLATEFGASASVLTTQKSELGATWGEMVIAHDIAANVKAHVTPSQLVQWHHDHMGWGQMAAGLGLELHSVMHSVDAEARIAEGEARADGKVAAMRGEGARGVGVGVNAGLGAEAGKGAVGAGAGAGAGLGIKIGH